MKPDVRRRIYWTLVSATPWYQWISEQGVRADTHGFVEKDPQDVALGLQTGNALELHPELATL
jgi:hypothetical protein